mmetsp:Transcript_21789/g.55321  ORF Transcript_21789/g.55321 Transcript_21789/m.55321 type:complete len:225 (+) Transcript_21789:108-782(+)
MHTKLCTSPSNKATSTAALLGKLLLAGRRHRVQCLSSVICRETLVTLLELAGGIRTTSCCKDLSTPSVTTQELAHVVIGALDLDEAPFPRGRPLQFQLLLHVILHLVCPGRCRRPDDREKRKAQQSSNGEAAPWTRNRSLQNLLLARRSQPAAAGGVRRRQRPQRQGPSQGAEGDKGGRVNRTKPRPLRPASANGSGNGGGCAERACHQGRSSPAVEAHLRRPF